LPFDFGEGSKIALFYRMSQSEIKDGDNYTGDYGPINFNVQGVIVLDKVEVKISKQKKEPEKKATGTKVIESDFDDDDIIEGEDEEELNDMDEFLEEIEEEVIVEKPKAKPKAKPKPKAKAKPKAKETEEEDEFDLGDLDDELMDAFNSEDGFSEEELMDDL